MAEAYYEPTPATDGASMNPVPGAVFQVFEISDTTFSTPLSLRVGAGNPTTSVAASDTLATLPGVYVTSPNFEHHWVSGSFVWRRDSIDGAKRAIEESASVALSAANAAADVQLLAESGAFKGDPGPQGDRGLPGPNAVANDVAFAAAVSTPGTETNTALSATIAERVGNRDRGESWAAKAAAKVGDMTIGLASDSTGVGLSAWFNKMVARWASEHPSIRVVSHNWNHTTQAYDSTTVQAPEPVTQRTFTDEFNRTATDLLGTSPNLGSPWAVSTGDGTGYWSIDGTKAVSTNKAQASPVYLWFKGAGAGNATITLKDVTLNTSVTGSGKALALHRYREGGNLIEMQYLIGGTGNVTWTLFKNIGGATATLASVTTAALPNQASITFDASLSIQGTTVTGTVNGQTITGTLSASDAAAIALADSGRMRVTPSLAGASIGAVYIDTESAGTASQTLTVYNGARNGSTLDYQADRLGMLYPVPIDLLFVSSCHNYWQSTITGPVYVDAVASFLAAYRAAHPESGIILSSQNPEYGPTVTAADALEHRTRLAALRAFAKINGYGYLPVLERFDAQPDGGVSLVLPDGVHPTKVEDGAPDPDNGAYLWATVGLERLNELVAD